MMATHQIETRRLLLRAPEPADRKAIVEGINNPQVVEWLARVPYPYHPEDADEWISTAVLAAEHGYAQNFAITVKPYPYLVGVVTLRELHETPELGYWLSERHWGQGLMTEAVDAVLGHGFDMMGLPLVASGVFRGNDASLAIQRKLGFIVTGMHPAYCAFVDGERPHIDTELTAERYRVAQRLRQAGKLE